jgi:pyridoxamine 5'-phosphate oxidase family protein
MSSFTESELRYLHGERRLARLATVGPDGMPHIAPVGWRLRSLSGGEQVIEVTGIEVEKTKKFRDVARTRRAAIVIDEVLPPWRPRGVEIRGRAEALRDPEPLIRLYPERIVAWGVDVTEGGERYAREVTTDR